MIRGLLTSPLVVMITGYVQLGIVILIGYMSGFYVHGDFFRIGPPLTILHYTIDSWNGFFTVLIVFFMHHLLNAWVSEVVYPWQVNEIQDPKTNILTYSSTMSLLLLNAFAMYSTLDIVFVVTAATTQISLLLAILLANAICVSIVNYRYIQNKLLDEPYESIFLDISSDN
jgi:hypothetical protein